MPNIEQDVYQIIQSGLSEDEKIRKIKNIFLKNQSSSNSSNSGGVPSKLDPYDVGYLSGRQYAMEVFANHGYPTVMQDVFDLPSGLEKMKLIDKIHESFAQDDDIRTILRDLNIDDRQKAKNICSIMSQSQGGDQAGENGEKNSGSSEQNQNIDNMTGQQAANAAQQAANQAQQAADQAQQASNAAQQAANQAQQAADQAQSSSSSSANQAQQAADQAQQAANAAQQAANRAQQAADQAQQAANESQNSAKKGDESSARAKAKEAMDAANQAQQAANQAGNNGSQQVSSGSSQQGSNQGQPSSSSGGSQQGSNQGQPSSSSGGTGSSPFGGQSVRVFNNGAFDENDPMGTNDVLTPEEGDAIRKENNIEAVDKGHFSKSDVTASTQESIGALKKVYNKYKAVKGTETDPVDFNALENNFKKSREGIIDWGAALRRFASRQSSLAITGPIMMNRLVYGGIKSTYQRKLKTNFNKCVLYIDTSGSVNNNMTQLIPIMCGEIVNIMKSCNFTHVDIVLFTTSCYKRFEVTPQKYLNQGAVLSEVKDGGTDIQSVYKDIYNTYTKKTGNLSSEINAVILITDISGMETGGDINGTWGKKLKPQTLSKMLYVVYNDYRYELLEQVKQSMNNLVSSKSSHVEISLEVFKRQIKNMAKKFNKGGVHFMSDDIDKYENKEQNETMSLKYKRKYKINEDIDDLDDDFFSSLEDDDAMVKTAEVSDEEIFRNRISSARTAGTLDRAIPDYIKQISDNFPQLQVVKNMDDVYGNENSYYVTNDVTFVINMNVNNDNVGRFMNLFGNKEYPIIVDRLIGNFDIDGDRGFTGFPYGFPQEVQGSVFIVDCDDFGPYDKHKMTTDQMQNLFKYAPNVITKNLCLSVMDRTFQSICDLYGKKMEEKGTHYYKLNSAFSRYSNESLQSIIQKRIAIGQAYLNESFTEASGLKKLFPYDGMPKSDRGVLNDNLRIFKKVIKPITNLPWGSLTDKDVKVVDQTTKMNDLIKKPSTEFNKLEMENYGIQIFSDENNRITMVYRKTGSKDFKMCCMNTSNGVITDAKELEQIIQDRVNKAFQISDLFDNMNISMKSIEEDDTIIEVGGHFLYIALAIAMGMTASYADKQSNQKLVVYDWDLDNLIDSKYVVNGVVDFNAIFDEISGGKYRQGRNDGTILFNGTSVSFDQRRKRNYGAGASETFKEILISTKINPYSFLSDDFAKAMLKGASIRKADEYDTFKFSDIDSFDRDDLMEAINNLKDVHVYDTLLKAKSCTAFRERNASLVWDNALLFPDLRSHLYSIDVDVPETRESGNVKRAEREVIGAEDISIDKVNYSGISEEANSVIEKINNRVKSFKDLSRLGVFEHIKDEINDQTFSDNVDDFQTYINLIISAIDKSRGKIVENDIDAAKECVSTLTKIKRSITDIANGDIDSQTTRMFIRNVGSLYDFYMKYIKDQIDYFDDPTFRKSLRTTMQSRRQTLADRRREQDERRKEAFDVQRRTREEILRGESEYDMKEFNDIVQQLLDSVFPANERLKSANFASMPTMVRNEFANKTNLLDVFADTLQAVAKEASNASKKGDGKFAEQFEDDLWSIANGCVTIATSDRVSDKELGRLIYKLISDCKSIMGDINDYKNASKTQSARDSGNYGTLAQRRSATA